MSFLAPLFMLGIAAVSAPILFHLIRRTPRGEQTFSSLMFLSPSPPRITRRSRLDNLLLLLLRALALVLIALAFARPFFRETAQLEQESTPTQLVAVVLDSSASIRRGDLWTQGVAAANSAIADLRPTDRLAVFLSDESLTPIISFDESTQLDPSQRRAAVAARLAEASPSWRATHLGQALIDAAAALSETVDESEEAGRSPRRIVLITDLQTGGRLDVLDGFPWPEDVEVDVHRLETREPTNAALERLAEAEGDSGEEESLRVRVWNDAGSARDQFQLVWQDEQGETVGNPIDAYIPAGESRVLEATLPREQSIVALKLEGDDHEFGNLLHAAANRPEVVEVVYFGDDAADDQDGLRYFLERAVANTGRGDVRFSAPEPGAPLDATQRPAPALLVVAAPLDADQLHYFRECVAAGSRGLVVATDAAFAENLAALWEVDSVAVTEADVENYSMWSEIDFQHPLFAPMSGPRFNDFTQIRFWAHRVIDVSDVPSAKVVASFDDGDPALIAKRLGEGELYVMTAGWQPPESQLALSWKFLRMTASLVHGFRSRIDESRLLAVGDEIVMPAEGDSETAFQVISPSGSELELAADDAGARRVVCEEPGVYRIRSQGSETTFAVNLDPFELRTDPMATETLEQWGCRLAGGAAVAPSVESARQLRDAELERRQDLWRWLIVAALATLALETWLAARTTRRLVSPIPTGTA